MPQFEASVTLRSTLEEVFEFLIRPDNILAVSDPRAGLDFIDPPYAFEAGIQFDLEISGLGMPQRVTHEIVSFERPSHFTERQVKGPLKLWVHEHRFEATGADEVIVVDQIQFEPPSGLLGMLATEARILSSLESGFQHRYAELKKHLGQSA